MKYSETGEGEVFSVVFVIAIMWAFLSMMQAIDSSRTTYVVDTKNKTVLERAYETQCGWQFKFWNDACDDEKKVSEYTYEYKQPRDLPADVRRRVRDELDSPDGVYAVEV